MASVKFTTNDRDGRLLYVDLSRGWGGGEEYLMSLLRGLSRRNKLISVLVRPDTPSHHRFIQADFPLELIILSDWSSVYRAMSRAQIVHFHRQNDLWLLPLCKLLACKVLLSKHICQRKYYWLADLCDLVTCNSRYVLNSWQAKQRKPAQILYPAVDMQSLPKPVVSEPSNIIICGGAYYKDQQAVIRGVAPLLIEKPDVELHICSFRQEDRFPQIEELSMLAKDLGISERVKFLYPLGREEYLQLLSRARFFAYAYTHEPFGLVVLEAALIGKPIVAYSGGGVSEILEDYAAASLVPAGDQQAYALALKERWELPIAQQGIDTAELNYRFSYERFLTEHENIYNNLTE